MDAGLTKGVVVDFSSTRTCLTILLASKLPGETPMEQTSKKSGLARSWRAMVGIAAAVGLIAAFSGWRVWQSFAQEPGQPASRQPNQTAKQASDWTAFLGPTGDGKTTETGLLDKWPQGGPKILWHLSGGTGYGIGAVSDGCYFHFDKFEGKARLLVVDAETGKEKWKFEYPSSYSDMYGYDDGPRCSPVIDDDRVYLYGVEGMLHCVSKADGSIVWKVDTQKEYGVIQNFFGVGSTPAIHNDLLLVMVGGSPEESQTLPPGQLERVEPNGSAVVAFDKLTGKEKYRVGNDLASYASMKVARADGKARDRDWGLAFCREGLLAFDPATGKEFFHYPYRAKSLESVNASVPVVKNDEVLLSETYGPGSVMLKLSASGEPKVVWQDAPQARQRAMQTHWNTAIEHEGYLYGSSGRHPSNAELRCIEWKSGKIKWSIPDLSRASLTYAEGKFYVMCEDGRLLLIAAIPNQYELLSEVDLSRRSVDGKNPGPILLRDPCWAAPILSHGKLYVRGGAGRDRSRVVCFDVRKGK